MHLCYIMWQTFSPRRMPEHPKSKNRSNFQGDFCSQHLSCWMMVKLAMDKGLTSNGYCIKMNERCREHSHDYTNWKLNELHVNMVVMAIKTYNSEVFSQWYILWPQGFWSIQQLSDDNKNHYHSFALSSRMHCNHNSCCAMTYELSRLKKIRFKIRFQICKLIISNLTKEFSYDPK